MTIEISEGYSLRQDEYEHLEHSWLLFFGKINIATQTYKSHGWIKFSELDESGKEALERAKAWVSTWEALNDH